MYSSIYIYIYIYIYVYIHTYVYIGAQDLTTEKLTTQIVVLCVGFALEIADPKTMEWKSLKHTLGKPYLCYEHALFFFFLDSASEPASASSRSPGRPSEHPVPINTIMNKYKIESIALCILLGGGAWNKFPDTTPLQLMFSS